MSTKGLLDLPTSILMMILKPNNMYCTTYKLNTKLLDVLCCILIEESNGEYVNVKGYLCKFNNRIAFDDADMITNRLIDIAKTMYNYNPYKGTCIDIPFCCYEYINRTTGVEPQYGCNGVCCSDLGIEYICMWCDDGYGDECTCINPETMGDTMTIYCRYAIQLK